MRKILIIFCAMFIGTAYACDTNQIDVLGDGTQCETAKFTITTTELEPDTEFKFYMSASGTFYVDWGDGTIDTITRTNTTETLYDHTYTTAGVKIIRFGGIATGYSTNTGTATIRFYVDGNQSETNAVKIASISGNLSAIFPWLSGNVADGAAPRFISTFYHATNLTSIPDTLFANYTRSADNMFRYTFSTCAGLTSISAGLFSGIKIGAKNMFSNSFAVCTGLTSIPAGLFSNITTGANSMFFATFYRCTGLKSIPAGLFSSITTGATDLFRATFESCNGLTTIPSDLFSGLTIGKDGMFRAMFFQSTGLKSIPAGLFSGIISDAPNMFYQTFHGCTNLSGYIPPSTFAGLIANGSPTATYMWNNTFLDTKLVKSCPAGTVQYTTGYEGTDTTNYTKWNGYVSCVDENLVCGAGEYLPAHWYQCETCPENNYCSGGTYTYNGNSQGATQCPNNLYSPIGMWESAQCGRILHIGDNVVYLCSTKKTSPALHIDIDNDGVADYFGNMTTLDVVMNANTDKKLKLQYGGQTYSVYDDTVVVP